MRKRDRTVEKESTDCCPQCGAANPSVALLTSLTRYFSCRRCEHRWQTAVVPRSDDAGPQSAAHGSISRGDVIISRVNGTSDLYVIGIVHAGAVGALLLSNVTTIVGLPRAVEEGYRHRTPDERVWLFDRTSSGFIGTTAPRSLLYL